MAGRGPGLQQIAAEAGVSKTTVSFVLNGKSGVHEATRQRVLSVAERLGYRLRSQRRIIGVLTERLHVPAYNDPALGLMIHGIEMEAGRRGYHMLLASVEAGTMQLPPMVTERQVSGLIVLGGGDLSDAYIRALQDAQFPVPIVLADNYVEGLEIPCILGDNATGGYMVARHLIALGHRRLAILEGPRKYKTLTERVEGALRALHEADLPIDPQLMVKPVPGSLRKGYAQMQALLALPRTRWPSAIFAISDKTALGALEALKDAGVRVPAEMALVGFDDLDEAAHVTPPLTSVHLPMQEIGQVAMQQLADIIEGRKDLPYKIVLYTRLVVRSSCGTSADASADAAVSERVGTDATLQPARPE